MENKLKKEAKNEPRKKIKKVKASHERKQSKAKLQKSSVSRNKAEVIPSRRENRRKEEKAGELIPNNNPFVCAACGDTIGIGGIVKHQLYCLKHYEERRKKHMPLKHSRIKI